jgi:NADPH:quinone reductase-like Zn-dependent oxidoreductase
VDVVFDTVGGDTQERAFQTLKRGGVLISTVSPPSAEKAKEFGVTVAMVVMMAKPDQLAEINRLVESGKLKARVATVLPLAEVKKAHQLSASGHAAASTRDSEPTLSNDAGICRVLGHATPILNLQFREPRVASKNCIL